MTTTKGIAETIVDQLTQSTNGFNRLIAMVGAHSFLDFGKCDDCLGGVSFKFKLSKKANYCSITLDYDDTYTVEFYKGFNKIESLSGVYAEDLKRIFEGTTGLSVKL